MKPMQTVFMSLSRLDQEQLNWWVDVGPKNDSGGSWKIVQYAKSYFDYLFIQNGGKHIWPSYSLCVRV